MVTHNPHDETWMELALRHAKHHLGTTGDNPVVACAIVDPRNQRLLSLGVTQETGRPHAEIHALSQLPAGSAKGCTAFVTLEPCSHTGRSGPCVEALIDAGINRLVVATADPFDQVAGRGIQRAKDAGIEVIEDVCAGAARTGNQGFFSRIERNKPFVTLKLAMTLDGKIAAAPGLRTKITGDQANQFSQVLRRNSDAILVGSGTVMVDDPILSLRLPGQERHQPLRVILDRRGRVPADARILNSPEVGPVLVQTTDLQNCLTALAGRGINNLLVEGGATIATAFLDQDLVDKLVLYYSPKLFGDQGQDALTQLSSPIDLHRKKFQSRSLQLGQDHALIFERNFNSAMTL